MSKYVSRTRKRHILRRKFYLYYLLTIAIISGVIMINSYALWRVVTKQPDDNSLVTACVNIEFEDTDELNKGINMASAWPLSDEDGSKLEGYDFKITNKCPNKTDYIITLEAVETDNDMDFKDVKIQLDDGPISTYDDLDSVDITPSTDYEGLLAIKKISEESVNGLTYNQHKLKIWLAEDADINAVEKKFRSRIKVTAGETIVNEEYELTPDTCFTFNEERGRIEAYDMECGTELVVPATINGIPVTSIWFLDIIYPSPSQYAALTNVDLTHATFLTNISGSFSEYVGTGKELIIPNSVTSVDNLAFESFNGSNLVLSKNMTSISARSFGSYVGSGKDLIIPDSVTTIYENAFRSYNGARLVLSKNVTSIGYYAFNNYVGTGEELVLPGKIKTLGGTNIKQVFPAFNGAKLTIEKGVEANLLDFSNYVGLGQDLFIPAGIKNVTMNKFQGKSITFEEGITSISGYGFLSYNGEDITIPSSVRNIGYDAFRNLGSDKNIYVKMTEEFFNQNVTKSGNWSGAAQVHFLGE